MPVKLILKQILALAPNARSSYRDAFSNAQPTLDRIGISVNPLRLAHFMAQVLHECGNLTIQFENLNYSKERLPIVWPSRFLPKGPLNPELFAHNLEKLANEVYGGRMGNNLPGDGFKYRGRGLLQLTGKDSYTEATSLIKKFEPLCPDFVADPDQVISSSWCIAVAAVEWESKGCNKLADQDLVRAITRKINGGEIGMADRIEQMRRAKNIWH